MGENEGVRRREYPEPTSCIAHDCAIKRHTGMGVTGACHCLSDIYDLPRGPERSRAVRRVHDALRWYQERLAAALARAERLSAEQLEAATRLFALAGERDRLEARAERAEKALERARAWIIDAHGPNHTQTCATQQLRWGPCDCGLRAALADEPDGVTP